MKNSNFKALVAKMDTLQETEQGKLKGGVRVINGSMKTALLGNGICKNGICGSQVK